MVPMGTIMQMRNKAVIIYLIGEKMFYQLQALAKTYYS